MSRLDDELRLAFRRQEPPPDFVDRVLSQVAAPPVAKASWWQTFLSLFQPPRVRWAVGVAAALVILIGSLLYANIQQPGGREEIAATPAAPSVKSEEEGEKKQEAIPEPEASPAPEKSQPPRPKRLHRPPVDSLRLARKESIERERREGEAAKERLMLALHIASTTLNEAQKIIRED